MASFNITQIILRLLYTKGSVQINVLVYVDELIISSNNPATIKTFKAYLSDCLLMKDLGDLKYFLGLEATRSSPRLIFVPAQIYSQYYHRVFLLWAKLTDFPIEQNHKLVHASEALLTDPESYRHLIGCLVYFVVTKPDLAFSIHTLSQFMQQPRVEHWEAALRVVRYLKGTPGQGIFLCSDSELTLTGWRDFD
ncbi:hypothetical protein GQ457_12G017230 [Hibiscus cannabinus]